MLSMILTISYSILRKDWGKGSSGTFGLDAAEIRLQPVHRRKSFLAQRSYLKEGHPMLSPIVLKGFK